MAPKALKILWEVGFLDFASSFSSKKMKRLY